MSDKLPIEEVEVKPAMLVNSASESLEGPEYQSSEQLARAHAADVFARDSEKSQNQALTEKQKLYKLLNSHIAAHSATKNVRKMAKTEGRSVEAQLDLSAELVTVLEQIKSELR